MSQTLRIFFDTEFSSFEDPWLISAGFVTESGKEWYGVASDYDEALSSEFVKENVLPLLNVVSPTESLPEKKLALALAEWVVSLGCQEVDVVCDYPGDWYILVDFAGAAIRERGVKLTGKLWSRISAGEIGNALNDEENTFWAKEGGRHNALVDARLLKNLVMKQETLLSQAGMSQNEGGLR